MQKMKRLIWVMPLCLLMMNVPMTAAQSESCGFLAEELIDGDDAGGEITDRNPYKLFCFDAADGDDVAIEIQTTDGDLVLEAAVANFDTLDFLIADAVDDENDGVVIELTIEEDGVYLIFVTREDFEDGDTEGEFDLEFDLDGAENDTNENDGEDIEAITFPDELEDYDGNWQDAIAELEDEGAIASGSLIFNESLAFFDGEGTFFTPLARNSTYSDVVVAGELTFTSDSRQFESCSLLARVVYATQVGSVSTFLEVGIDNDGFAYWADANDGDFDSGGVDLDLDLDDSHHVLFIAQHDSLTVYIDGELTFEQVEIPSRGGSFGIALIGRGAGSRCEGANIWAYQAPVLVPGLCEASSPETVTRRSGPGTMFDTDGTLNAGEPIEVLGSEEGVNGLIWYELEGGAWVREDVVTLIGDCAGI